jgi:hypothetical protein
MWTTRTSPHILTFIEENSHQATKKAEKRKREAMQQEEIFIDLNFDKEI